jgi:hypothetical protein
MVDLSTSPFGSLTRSRVLMALRLRGTSYARELARVFELNPRQFAASEVRALVDKLAGVDGDLQDRIATLRRRPRRSQKPL